VTKLQFDYEIAAEIFRGDFFVRAGLALNQSALLQHVDLGGVIVRAAAAAADRPGFVSILPNRLAPN
jgi:hypothetical protein